ncbi:PucR family transcriptional regulator ligand-binding domain-containing protein [Streptomyces sp. RFCAC02]|uniref:PucR family transcriptional regulator ligand-binding domain-containing protein n=1 Tax=Streptomyces sp. RFCAC02 TaxID=2499143 RepID=UPI00102149AA|nr:PucR family transcriptional regulator ligand-binding domain-containing protein [Streptomyces sp. RFCAC02]
MRLAALLETGAPGLRLLAGGAADLERRVSGVMTTDLRDPSRYLRGGELVLTGLAWWRGPGDAGPFVRALVTADVTALAAGEAEFGAVPGELTAACAASGLPLFAVPEEVPFADLTEYVMRRVSGERAGDLAALVERHRRLVDAGPGGDGPQAVLDLLRGDLGLPAWVLSPTGRRVAGREPLSAEVARELVRQGLRAARTGRPAPYRCAAGAVHALFPIRPDGGPAASGLPADRLLAVRSDPADWPAERHALLAGVARLLAAERDPGRDVRAVRRRLAREVVDLLAAGAPAAEVGARLRVARPARTPAVPEPRWQVVTARLTPPGGAGPGADAVRTILEELLPDAAVASGDDGEAVALVPVAGELLAGPLLAPVRTVVAAGLGPGARLTFGVSGAVAETASLGGALEEARHARRAAAARPGPVEGAGREDLASHVLLLPFVPGDVRRAFTGRLLDPLRAYDRRHGAQLVRTLEEFLAADRSWTRCAARLHVHVNTLRYRIGRVEHLTGRDLSRLEDAVDFLLALRMR